MVHRSTPAAHHLTATGGQIPTVTTLVLLTYSGARPSTATSLRPR
ncbi:hypothetical protein M6B38_141820 [Iris pallida]|uniref:Uncharacterized protein n=1 Tax=Iris pallida TaxID=29817 RepID=A0AAX6E6W5_IRIPA|nr:hypothetical protein M6B38_204560 [Iris pallida]KAJ6813881.1 hypothetical protein M6B38_141820 [Iris pallida]